MTRRRVVAASPFDAVSTEGFGRSQFSHVFSKSIRGRDVYAFYHSLRGSLVYGGPKARDIFLELPAPSTELIGRAGGRAILDCFRDEGLVSTAVQEQDDRDFSKPVEVPSRAPQIQQLLLMVTSQCNFACRYC